MRRRWLALLLCLQVCAGAGGHISRVALAQQKATADVSVNALRVDERATRVSFDRVRAAVGEEIVCRVEAERVGHSGCGLRLAEVGLPPCADVDRQTLERAMKETGRGLGRYDVQPDRLVVYLRPRAGGTRFSFSFRPRLGMNAKAAASQLYDYYNPEARRRRALRVRRQRQRAAARARRESGRARRLAVAAMTSRGRGVNMADVRHCSVAAGRPRRDGKGWLAVRLTEMVNCAG